MYDFDPGDLVACDTETTGLLAWKGDAPFAISMCNREGDTWYCEWPVDPTSRRVYARRDDIEFIRSIVSNPKITKIFHNAKFDIRMLDLHCGIKLEGRLQETLFAAHTVNTLEPTFGLKALAKKYLKVGDEDQKELKNIVNACRRRARAFNAARLKTGKPIKYNLAKDVEADYWLPQHFFKQDSPQRHLCRQYAVLDAVRTMGLWQLYCRAMKHEETRHTYDAEIALWPVTYAMETRGVAIDRVIVDRDWEYYKGIMDEAKAEMVELSEMEDLNPNSDVQLACVLFEKFGLPISEYTATGQPSTNAQALEEHAEHPFCRALFKYRAGDKAISSFFQKFRDLSVYDPDFDRWILHANFNQVGPVTGRYSCREPNLQNVANALTTRSTEPIQARRPFGPRPGYVWYCNDYSQLEVRIFADVSQEPTLIDAIQHDRDLHTECANKAWGGQGNQVAVVSAIQSLELTEAHASSPLVAAAWEKHGWKPGAKYAEARARVAESWLAEFEYNIVKAEKSLEKKTARARAKMVLFAKLFGGGPNAIKDLLKVSYKEAAHFLDTYDEAFPDIVGYIREISNEGRRNGYIRNRWGRKLRVDPDKPYRACNYMVQGSAADFMKDSMVRCDAYLRETGLDARIVMTIHDELVFEVRKEHAFKWMLRGIRNLMEDHGGRFTLGMPTEMARVRVAWDKKEEVKL